MKSKLLFFATGFVSGVLATKLILNNLTIKMDNESTEEEYIKVEPKEKSEEIIINLN